ncbi:hypothetical protein P3T76_004295 [Phytophthora citrophthora]|uniref:Uncharacterized protein n=1 Tax=Phytophthora citrophthora TaxID=4793 RepID=A0AAD9GUB1_9STRA|nr:hypothetical protein P3T76_004295 [Phytophthora citrophthora]
MGGGGVGAAFEATLKRVGTKLTSDDLTRLYPTPTAWSEKEINTPLVLEDCKFFDLFDADPVEVGKENERIREQARQHLMDFTLNLMMSSKKLRPLKRTPADYRLKPDEKAKLASNGFVVVERMPAESFAEIYYRLYTDDMPVFVTADSVLHAWHRSFDTFLVKVEGQVLSPTLCRVLMATLDQCANAISAAPMSDDDKSRAMVDVELFLRVAISLLRGTRENGLCENTNKLECLLTLIRKEEPAKTEILSAKRDIDFSEFKPRGHYTVSVGLMRYFRCLVWLGTIDFRIAGGEQSDQNLHQLRCAITLINFLQESKMLEIVETLDIVISNMVGDERTESDLLSPTRLAQLLSVEAESCDQHPLESIQELIIQKTVGTQLIDGQPRTENERTSISLAVLGQQFIWSSFIFSRLVSDHVISEDEKAKPTHSERS